jgi:hypothetical protein
MTRPLELHSTLRDARLRLAATLMTLDEMLARPVERTPVKTIPRMSDTEREKLRIELESQTRVLREQLAQLRRLLNDEHRITATWAAKAELAVASQRETLALDALRQHAWHVEEAAMLEAEVAEHELTLAEYGELLGKLERT